MKIIERILFVLIIILLLAGVYAAMRNISFFDVKDIEISVSGPVTNISADMQRLINPLKGKNLLEVNTSALEKSLEAFEVLNEVSIKRFYQNRLIIDILYNEIRLKAYSISDDRAVSYYFIHENVLEEVSKTTWEAFDRLATVELNPAYAQMVMKWGSDEGFSEMVTLAEHLSSNNLITSIKYANNNGNDFGRLVIDLSMLNSTLYVRELVSIRRLDEALGLISSQFSAGGAGVVYDLYANTLVKRT